MAQATVADLNSDVWALPAPVINQFSMSYHLTLDPDADNQGFHKTQTLLVGTNLI